LYTGTPGVILFLIELHHVTRDNTWLDLAVAGANNLAASLPDAMTATDSPGLYSGLAGVAFTLDETARATGDARYRTASLKALGVISASVRDVGAGAEWDDTTDIISGSAGIGLYLMHRSSMLADVASRQLAARVGRRLLEREYRHG